ncbi:helix-turn-helix domain-containing protein (plasmid) [Deinococcus sp. VB343]|uniref:helix-turn-helix domain-containing protein n=1 Tax=Deinococcus sp. VB343 TaxID=3385567 RepID=UPI0039C988FF
MPDNITGERIRKVRHQLRHDQADLVVILEEKCGLRLTQSDISKIEQGQRYVKDYELNALAEALNVSPTWLLRGGEEK